MKTNLDRPTQDSTTDATRHDTMPQTCPTCQGTGKVYDLLCQRWRPCQDCDGWGFVSVRKVGR